MSHSRLLRILASGGFMWPAKRDPWRQGSQREPLCLCICGCVCLSLYSYLSMSMSFYLPLFLYLYLYLYLYFILFSCGPQVWPLSWEVVAQVSNYKSTHEKEWKDIILKSKWKCFTYCGIWVLKMKFRWCFLFRTREQKTSALTLCPRWTIFWYSSIIAWIDKLVILPYCVFLTFFINIKG